MTRTAWIGGVLIGLLQFALPAVLVGWALVHAFLGAFSTPQPEVKAPAASADAVWYTAPVPSEKGSASPSGALFEAQRALLRIPRHADGKPTEVARFEGSLRDPVLVARDNGVFVLDENGGAMFAEGTLTPHAFDPELPRRSWPVGRAGAPAVVVLERDFEGAEADHVLSLRTFDGSRWDALWSEPVALAWSPDVLRAVALPDGVHIFVSDSDHLVRSATHTDAGLSAWSTTPVEAWEWSVAGLQGRPALVALEETDVTTFARGWRLLDDGWAPLFRAEVESASSIGATTLLGDDGEHLGVLTDALLDGVWLLEVNTAGEVEQHEHSASTVMDEALAMVVLSQIAPFALTLGFAAVVTASMRRHRVCEFVHEGRTVRYASVAKRGAAKAVDSLLALCVPAAILGPEVMDGQLDEVRIAVVCIAWALPLGLAITAWEGARGTTPGKRLLGIRVVGLHLQPPGFGASFMRGLMGIADGFFSYMVGIVIVALHARWQRLGDQVADTLVIEDRR